MKKQIDPKIAIAIIVIVLTIVAATWLTKADKKNKEIFRMNTPEEMEQYRNGLGGGIPVPTVPQGPQIPAETPTK